MRPINAHSFPAKIAVKAALIDAPVWNVGSLRLRRLTIPGQNVGVELNGVSIPGLNVAVAPVAVVRMIAARLKKGR